MPTMVTYRNRIISGITWNSSARVAALSIQFAISVILARMLSPRDFGMVGMILVFTGFAEVFRDLGFGPALIQRQTIGEAHRSSVFWLNLMTGALLFVLLFIASPWIAGFYARPMIEPMTKALSCVFVLNSFNIVQISLLRRSLNFRSIGLIEIISTISGGASAVTMAVLGYGVWSLIWQPIISASIAMILVWSLSPWRPSFLFNLSAIKELSGFGVNLFGFNIFNYGSRNADNLVIGKFIGASGLGIYAMAYKIMLLPVNQISATIGQVMFPSLSMIQTDKERVKAIFLKVIGVIALVTFPMMTGLMAVSQEFIDTLLGPKWVMLSSILQIFCIIGLVQSIVSTLGWIYHSQGRTDLLFRWGIVTGTLSILCFLIGAWIGSIEAIAVCYAILNLLLIYPNFAIPGRLIGMTVGDVIKTVSGPFLCSWAMALVILLTSPFLQDIFSSETILLGQIVFGVLFYTLLVCQLNVPAFSHLKGLVNDLFSTPAPTRNGF